MYRWFLFIQNSTTESSSRVSALSLLGSIFTGLQNKNCGSNEWSSTYFQGVATPNKRSATLAEIFLVIADDDIIDDICYVTLQSPSVPHIGSLNSIGDTCAIFSRDFRDHGSIVLEAACTPSDVDMRWAQDFVQHVHERHEVVCHDIGKDVFVDVGDHDNQMQVDAEFSLDQVSKFWFDRMWMRRFWMYHAKSADMVSVEECIFSCVCEASRRCLEGSIMSQLCDEDFFQLSTTGKRKMKNKPGLIIHSEQEDSIEGEVVRVDHSHRVEEHDGFEERSEGTDQRHQSTLTWESMSADFGEPPSSPDVSNDKPGPSFEDWDDFVQGLSPEYDDPHVRRSSITQGLFFEDDPELQRLLREDDNSEGSNDEADQYYQNISTLERCDSPDIFDRDNWFSQKNVWCATANEEEFNNEVVNRMNTDPAIHESRKPFNRASKLPDSQRTSLSSTTEGVIGPQSATHNKGPPNDTIPGSLIREKYREDLVYFSPSISKPEASRKRSCSEPARRIRERSYDGEYEQRNRTSQSPAVRSFQIWDIWKSHLEPCLRFPVTEVTSIQYLVRNQPALNELRKSVQTHGAIARLDENLWWDSKYSRECRNLIMLASLWCQNSSLWPFRGVLADYWNAIPTDDDDVINEEPLVTSITSSSQVTSMTADYAQRRKRVTIIHATPSSSSSARQQGNVTVIPTPPNNFGANDQLVTVERPAIPQQHSVHEEIDRFVVPQNQFEESPNTILSPGNLLAEESQEAQLRVMITEARMPAKKQRGRCPWMPSTEPRVRRKDRGRCQCECGCRQWGTRQKCIYCANNYVQRCCGDHGNLNVKQCHWCIPQGDASADARSSSSRRGHPEDQEFGRRFGGYSQNHGDRSQVNPGSSSQDSSGVGSRKPPPGRTRKSNWCLPPDLTRLLLIWVQSCFVFGIFGQHGQCWLSHGRAGSQSSFDSDITISTNLDGVFGPTVSGHKVFQTGDEFLQPVFSDLLQHQTFLILSRRQRASITRSCKLIWKDGCIDVDDWTGFLNSQITILSAFAKSSNDRIMLFGQDVHPWEIHNVCYRKFREEKQLLSEVNPTGHDIRSMSCHSRRRRWLFETTAVEARVLEICQEIEETNQVDQDYQVAVPRKRKQTKLAYEPRSVRYGTGLMRYLYGLISFLNGSHTSCYHGEVCTGGYSELFVRLFGILRIQLTKRVGGIPDGTAPVRFVNLEIGKAAGGKQAGRQDDERKHWPARKRKVQRKQKKVHAKNKKMFGLFWQGQDKDRAHRNARINEQEGWCEVRVVNHKNLNQSFGNATVRKTTTTTTTTTPPQWDGEQCGGEASDMEIGPPVPAPKDWVEEEVHDEEVHDSWTHVEAGAFSSDHASEGVSPIRKSGPAEESDHADEAVEENEQDPWKTSNDGASNEPEIAPMSILDTATVIEEEARMHALAIAVGQWECLRRRGAETLMATYRTIIEVERIHRRQDNPSCDPMSLQALKLQFNSICDCCQGEFRCIQVCGCCRLRQDESRH